MTKVVTIDARWLVGGIGTYTSNLLAGFAEHRADLEVHAIARKKDESRVREWCSHVTVVNAPIYTFREQLLMPRAVRSSALLHVPHFNVPLLHRGPLLVSIMDVIHLSSPAYRDNLSSSLYARPMLHWAARKSAHIITVSEFSKREIIRVLGVPEDKITVVHCAASSEFHPRDRRKAAAEVEKHLPIRAPYLLYVGNLKPHKNVSTLLKAFAQWRCKAARNLSHSLLIVGDDARWKSSLVREAADLGLGDSVAFASHVSQQLLPTVYAAADALIMPSTVEGFGLPVLEAMACGTPVICSTAGSLPEVAGDAALFFDPSSVKGLCSSLETMLGSEDLRRVLVEKGIARAARYSWSESNRKHVQLYHRLLAARSAAVAYPEVAR